MTGILTHPWRFGALAYCLPTVTVVVQGANADFQPCTDEIVLDPDEINQFRQGSTAFFHCCLRGIETLARIRLGHPADTAMPLWSVAEVIFTEVSTGSCFSFACNRFVDTWDADRKWLSVELEPQSWQLNPDEEVCTASRVHAALLVCVHVACKHQDREDMLILTTTPANVPAAQVRYNFIVSTSDIRGAGTDLQVYVRLLGEGGRWVS